MILVVREVYIFRSIRLETKTTSMCLRVHPLSYLSFIFWLHCRHFYLLSYLICYTTRFSVTYLIRIFFFFYFYFISLVSFGFPYIFHKIQMNFFFVFLAILVFMIHYVIIIFFLLRIPFGYNLVVVVVFLIFFFNVLNRIFHTLILNQIQRIISYKIYYKFFFFISSLSSKQDEMPGMKCMCTNNFCLLWKRFTLEQFNVFFLI